MKRKQIIALLLIIVLVAVGYGYRQYTRTNQDLLGEEAAFSFDPTTLISAFEKDSIAFNQKYTDKVIAVNGVVKKIDADGNPVIIQLGEAASMSSIQCSMDSAHANAYQVIKQGDAVSIKGMCTGGRTEELFGTDVILNRCVLTKQNN
jgi:hypothetical protein